MLAKVKIFFSEPIVYGCPEVWEPMSGLIVIGGVIVFLTSVMILSNHFIDPGVRVQFDLSVSVKKNIISHKDVSPIWYWITNSTLIVLGYVLIFAGIVLERAINCHTGARVPGFWPRIIDGIPFYTYLIFIALIAALWMPFLISIRGIIINILTAPSKTHQIVTTNGLDVTIPHEIIMDLDDLREFLKQYRTHEDFSELSESALKLAKQVQKG